MPFDLLYRLRELRPDNLTIREQARLEENPLDLRWQALFPRRPVNSLKIRDITKVELRLTAEYRAWNANGRELWEAIGPQTEWEILPLTASKHFDEKRMLELGLPDPSIRALVDNGLVADVDRWASLLADAVHRKIEATAFQEWYNNSFSMMDAVTGSVITGPLGFSATRYITEATAWNNGAVNAYDRFVYHTGQATRLQGGQPGVFRTRQIVLEEVVKDAPQGANAMRPTITNVQDRLSEQGIATLILADERTYDKSTDGGQATTITNYVPAGKGAFQPRDGRIGTTPSVPATRGGKELVTNKKVNLQDVTVWYSELNRGMTLLEEAENIAVPMPEEPRLYVVDTLIV
jgi:hypothetical protein